MLHAAPSHCTPTPESFQLYQHMRIMAHQKWGRGGKCECHLEENKETTLLIPTVLLGCRNTLQGCKKTKTNQSWETPLHTLD